MKLYYTYVERGVDKRSLKEGSVVKSDRKRM